MLQNLYDKKQKTYTDSYEIDNVTYYNFYQPFLDDYKCEMIIVTISEQEYNYY